MADKKATREAYGAALCTLGEKYDFLVLDADLAAATKTGMFKKKFPERFFDCGIAEGNMMSVAAGIASTGKLVFASSFAMFAAGRAFEQVRNSIGYPHLNVKIGATHAGITVGEDGATHQCNEDIALMRTIPGMTVICVFTVFATTICGTKTANAPISIDATPVSAKFTSERSTSITHRKSSASRTEISCTEAYRSTKAIAMPFTVHKVNPPMKYKITDMPDITA